MTTELKTDFNVSPYFDDFDETKNFYRILFRPATAVQARELTQLQTILQEQTKRFGSHIFKDGSIIDGAAVTYHPNIPVVHLENTFDANTTIAISEVNGYLAYANSGVRGEIKTSEQGFLINYPLGNRFYVDYISTGKDGSNNDINSFKSGDKLFLYNTDQDRLGTLDANNFLDSIDVITANGIANAVGTGYGLSITDGVIFQKGFFTKVLEQTIIIRANDQLVSNHVVGFETTESTVTESADSSLFDNSNGSPNVNAPGAHRLKLTPTLVAKLRSETANNTNFFAIIEFDNGNPTQQLDDSVYNKLGEEFSRRTSEESGDYIIKPFTVETLTHSSNSELMNYEVSPGIAYIKGNRVELIGSRTVEAERGLDTKEALDQLITANFGSYVIIDEALGVFNFDDLEEITFYDTAQNAVSEYEGADAAPAGSIVGFANIRNVQYNAGQKGSANGQFRLYIFNIRMDSLMSFSSDVKSIFANNATLGPAKGDVVLESGAAVLKESSTSTLVFPIGVATVKRLRDSAGVNDTQFIFRDIKSDTMDANGIVTFTINTPAAGGVERLNDGVGFLSDTSEKDYSIVLSADAYSANITGTVDLSNANTLIVGAGTLFETEYEVGEFFRASNSTASHIRRVVSITDNTNLNVDTQVNVGETAADIQNFYPDGHVISLLAAAGGGTLEILSNTQFTVDTKLATHGGDVIDTGSQTVFAQYPVRRTAAVQSAKDIKKTRFVKIDTQSHSAGVSGPWGLGLADIHKITNVYVDTSGSDTYLTSNPERKIWFDLDPGQRDNFYDFGKLVIKPQFASKINATTTILVELDHFEINTSGGIGFFSIDSYPIDDANTANTTAIQTAEMPQFNSEVLGTSIELRDSIDFRPVKLNVANSATIIADATENPADAANGFAVPATGQYMIEPDSNFQTDMEYFIPRMDLLTMTKEGDLVVRKGQPNEIPHVPFNESDAMAIASIYVPAFPSLTNREGEAFLRNDIKTNVRILTNRRYTMRDIGGLAQRIKTLEYYTVLNALEQGARDLTVPDASGLDRFKNGIFADPMNSHELANVSDFEHKIAIDADNGIARPIFGTTAVDLEYHSANSSGVQRAGNYLLRPFSEEILITQRYASKFRICTQSVWKFTGIMDLYPGFDHFRDETRLPAVSIDLEYSQPWEDFAAVTESSFTTRFGHWRHHHHHGGHGHHRREHGDRHHHRHHDRHGHRGHEISTTTTRTQERIVSEIQVETLGEDYSFGSFLKDVSIQPYIRGREVAFIISGMKPDTTVHAFFDSVNVDIHTAPGTISGITDFVEGLESRAVVRTGAYGDALITDSSGNLAGVFRIPDGEFRVGDRQFQILNISDIVAGTDAILTSARAVYTASSLAISSQELTLNTVQPQVSVGSPVETMVTVQTTTQAIPPPPVPVSPPVEINNDNVGDGGNSRQDLRGDIGAPRGQGGDPIAQSFYVTRPGSGISGVFTTSIGVYFQSKDQTLGISCYIMEMRVGFPDTAKIVAKSHITSAEVNVSATAETETVFTFDNPIFLTTENYYALMIQPDGNSPEYNIWMSEVGGIDIVTGEQIFSNPYVGVAYVSANRNVWTPLQTEDIKFNLYRADFEIGTGTVVFKNENDEYFTIDGITKANSEIGVAVGDVVYTQNSSGGLLTGNTDPFGVIQFLDEATGDVRLNASTGGFIGTDVIEFHRPIENGDPGQISGASLIANATILSVDNKNYSSIVPRFATIEPVTTQIGINFKGMNTSFLVDSEFAIILGETEKEYVDFIRTIASYSNELTTGGGAKSAEYAITLRSENSFVSPLIDLRRKSTLAIENLINNDATDEHTRYGNALTRYISRNLILADGQEAEDIRVYITAYRPVGTDIKVYVKFLNQEDGDQFVDKVWTLLDSDVGSAAFSSPIDIVDYKEFEFGVPIAAPETNAAFLNATNSDVIEYSNASGSRFIGFKTFAIKIVLLSDNGARVPRINDLRAIALQK